MAHKYKRIIISSKEETIRGLTSGVVGDIYYHAGVSREVFLEVINHWNRLVLLQSQVDGEIKYLYIAL